MEMISFYLSDNQLPPGYLHQTRTLTATFTPSGASDTTLAALATASSLWIQTSHQILEQHYREELSHKYTILYNTSSCPDWQEAWYLGVTWAQKLLSEPLRDYLLQDIRDSLPKFYGNWPTRDYSPFQLPLTHCQPHSEDEGDTTLQRAHTSRPSPSPRTHGHPTSGRYPLKEDSTSPLPESSNTTTPETNISPIQQRTTRTPPTTSHSPLPYQGTQRPIHTLTRVGPFRLKQNLLNHPEILAQTGLQGTRHRQRVPRWLLILPCHPTPKPGRNGMLSHRNGRLPSHENAWPTNHYSGTSTILHSNQRASIKSSTIGQLRTTTSPPY